MTKVILNQICYSHFLWFVFTFGRQFEHWHVKITLVSGPLFSYEGVSGYAECKVEIECAQSNLGLVCTAWDSFYTISDEKRREYQT